MSNISSWSTSSAANSSASPDGFPEGMAPSGVNDSAREVMGAVKRWYVQAEWVEIPGGSWVRQSANSFLVSVTATDIFTAGRRLRMNDATTIYGDVIASSMSGANTLVTVSSTALTSSLSSGYVSIFDPANRGNPDIGALTSTASVTASDYVEVFQSGTGLRRKALITNAVRGSGLSLQTEVDLSTLATSFTLASSIPVWVKRITISIVGFSTNGTSNIQIQIGDSGGVETSGYSSVAARVSSATASVASTAGFLIVTAATAADTYHGQVTLCLEDSSDNTWSYKSNIAKITAVVVDIGAGSKALTATLDRVILTMANGTDTGDAGVASVLLEG